MVIMSFQKNLLIKYDNLLITFIKLHQYINIKVRIVSVPSFELSDKQNRYYKNMIINYYAKLSVSIEALSLWLENNFWRSMLDIETKNTEIYIKNIVTIILASFSDYQIVQNMARFYIYDLARDCHDMSKNLIIAKDGLFYSKDFKIILWMNHVNLI